MKLLDHRQRRLPPLSGWLAGVPVLLAGCVSVYHPMSGLHRPVVVDMRAPNFTDVDLTVVCLPGELLRPAEASVLCQRVGALFENQGARVQTFTGGRSEALGGELPEDDDAAAGPRPTDLVLELRSEKVHHSNDPLSWTLAFFTFTLVPGITETTFAQQITIRDGTGFLLVTDRLEGRIVHRIGAGPWVGNKLLDWIVRDDDEKLTGDVIYRDVSTDLYRQLSQLTYNAKLHWQVLSDAGEASR